MRATGATSRHDSDTTRGYVVWIIAYAAIMVCVFAFQDSGGIAPNLMPSGFNTP